MHTTRLLALLSSLMLAVPGISSASDVVVDPTDKTSFQDVLDAADPGDEIVCRGGVYDFSRLGAVLITKGLKIVADDSSNPPVFRGLRDVNLQYVNDLNLMLPPGPTNLTGNTAFAVPPGAVADGLEMEGLHFEGFNRAITTLVGFDFNAQGDCWLLLQPGSLNNMILEDNHISNCGTGMQILGGPLEDFEIRNNFIDCSMGNNSPALNVQGDYVPCGAPFANVLRLVKGKIRSNEIHGGPGAPAVNVAGVEDIQVKDNTVYGNSAAGPAPGILVRDFKAVTITDPEANLFFAGADPPFGDDGPIQLGQIKDNLIYNAGFGIVCQAATTLENVEIKNNTMVNTVVIDILLAGTVPGFNGSNGFIVKNNTFSGTAAAFEVFLGGPTFNNVITVPSGTRVGGNQASNTVNFE